MSSLRIWYRVRDLDAARDFYVGVLGFTETFRDEEGRWATLDRGPTQIALTEGDPDPGEEGAIAAIDVEDVMAERERLESEHVEVGTVLELHGAVRLLDVFDPDGNRIQLTEEVA
jgi:catechol 2,3-dioxygenase-like lactoylglutathione lyase family enzyme